MLASVASAETADADAALDAAEAAMADWAARTPRQRSEVLRKAWELMTARLDDFAHYITLENGKAGVDAAARPPMPPSSFAGSPRRPCAPTG